MPDYTLLPEMLRDGVRASLTEAHAQALLEGMHQATQARNGRDPDALTVADLRRMLAPLPDDLPVVFISRDGEYRRIHISHDRGGGQLRVVVKE